MRGGSAKALTRRLYRSADALALYAALTEGGTRTDTMLLETLAGPSLILDQAAVRVEGRGREVRIDALGSGGGAVLRLLAERFRDCIAAHDDTHLVLRFAPPTGDDSEARLLAPSPFDVLRALSTGMTSE
ncbi:MAG TPA: hypothetical protein VGB65_00285, partial [Allosphingosinicella sp.]